jgi:hypothetical protein
VDLLLRLDIFSTWGGGAATGRLRQKQPQNQVQRIGAAAAALIASERELVLEVSAERLGIVIHRETLGVDLWGDHVFREGPNAHPSQDRGRVGHPEKIKPSNRRTIEP